MAPSRITQDDVATCDPDDLAAALRIGAHGSNLRTGAVEALTGYNAGDLLRFRHIRDLITVDSDGGAHLRWSRLHMALLADDGEIGGMLSSTAYAAALFACAIACGSPMTALDRAIGNWGNHNAPEMARAFALACRQPDPIANAAALDRIRALAKALTAEGGRTLAAADAAALITTVLAGGARIPDLIASAGWVPATKEETALALAAAAEAMTARARLADQPRPAGELGLTGQHTLDEAVLAVITDAGTVGVDRDQVAERLSHTAPTHVLTQSLVRLAGPASTVVFRFGRYYLASQAPSSVDGDPWPLDNESLAAYVYDVLDAAGPTGATAAAIVEALAARRKIDTTVLAVTIALGMLSARDNSVSQPTPHGPVYLVRHLKPTLDAASAAAAGPDYADRWDRVKAALADVTGSTTTSSTGPATPFEQPEQPGPGRVFTGLPPQTPATESAEALDAAVLSIIRESDELDDTGRGITLAGICAGYRVKHLGGPVSAAVVARSVERLTAAGHIHNEDTADAYHFAPTGK